MRLVQKILANVNILICDPFGNYVIQYVMEHGSQEESNAIAVSTLGHLVSLMCQKFSSNVIEKLFTVADEAICSQMVHETVQDPLFPSLLHHNVGDWGIVDM